MVLVNKEYGLCLATYYYYNALMTLLLLSDLVTGVAALKKKWDEPIKVHLTRTY